MCSLQQGPVKEIKSSRHEHTFCVIAESRELGEGEEVVNR
jgi:hypothetical protein